MLVSYRHDSSLLITLFIEIDSVGEARLCFVELGHIELSIGGHLVLARPVVAFISACRDLSLQVVEHTKSGHHRVIIPYNLFILLIELLLLDRHWFLALFVRCDNSLDFHAIFNEAGAFHFFVAV